MKMLLSLRPFAGLDGSILIRTFSCTRFAVLILTLQYFTQKQKLTSLHAASSMSRSLAPRFQTWRTPENQSQRRAPRRWPWRY